MSIIWTAKNVRRRLLGRPVLADPAKAPLSAAVKAALALPTLGIPSAKVDPVLAKLAAAALARPVQYTSRELFSLQNTPLPGWREEDVGLEDDWVTADNYYPLYHRFFQEVALRCPSPKLLEIGVRTGYVGLCFARAIPGSANYIGVDPNLYLPDSLTRARNSFAAIAAVQPGFQFKCLLGYSENPAIQRRLHAQGPFDLIHVDGDHTLQGKLLDLDLCRSLLKPDGIVLVDDYTHIPAVIQEAASRALHLGWYTRFAVFDTKRGCALLQL